VLGAEGAEGAAGVAGAAGPDGGASDGFVKGAPYAYASEDRKLEVVSAASQILNMAATAAMSKLPAADARFC
jgi:hypothetical protein